MSGPNMDWIAPDTVWTRAVEDMLVSEGNVKALEALEAAMGNGEGVCSSLNAQGYSLAVLVYADRRQSGSWPAYVMDKALGRMVARRMDYEGTNHLGMGALAQGLKFQAFELARLALGKCDVARADHSGETPLMLASQLIDGHELFHGVLAACVAAGADVDARDNLGRTALMRAAGMGKDGHVIDLFLAGASACLTDAQGQNAYHHAARMGYRNPIDILGSYGTQCKLTAAAASAVDQEGFSPLGRAAKSGWDHCVRACLDLAMTGQQGPDGSTALMWAAADGSEASVKSLLPRSDPADRDIRGASAADYAKEFGHGELHALLLAASERSELAADNAGVRARSERSKSL